MQGSNFAIPDIKTNTGARRLKLEVIGCKFSALTTDGKEPEPNKDEPNQNPDFDKKQTEPESKKKYMQEPKQNRTLPHKELNRTPTQMS